MPLRCFVLLCCLIPCAIALEDWEQVSDFAATGIHQHENQVVIWNAGFYLTSTDGGASWSAPLAAGDEATISHAVASADGFHVLTSAGAVVGTPIAGRFSKLLVDGRGRLWAQDGQGHVCLCSPTIQPVDISGTLYRAWPSGVVVQRGRTQLSIVTAPDKIKHLKAFEGLPPAFELAPLTGKPLPYLMESSGRYWEIAGGEMTPMYSRKGITVHATWAAQAGPRELVTYRDQHTIGVDRNGHLMPDPRLSRQLPAQASQAAGWRHMLVISPVGVFRFREAY